MNRVGKSWGGEGTPGTPLVEQSGHVGRCGQVPSQGDGQRCQELQGAGETGPVAAEVDEGQGCPGGLRGEHGEGLHLKIGYQQIKMMSTNIRGFNSKKEVLSNIVTCIDTNVVFVQETHTTAVSTNQPTKSTR